MPDFQTDAAFWDNRYRDGKTGWDLGMVSPPLQHYIDQIQNKGTRILIPGAGNAYEAGYLIEQGFTDVTVLDISTIVTQRVKAINGKKAHGLKVICGDFFLHQGQYDLILEQTFFCAFPPSRRPEYVGQVLNLLGPAGRLSGVLFDRDFKQEGPPYSGNKAEYEALFSPGFQLKTLSRCYNSIPDSIRENAELFIIAIPK